MSTPTLPSESSDTRIETRPLTSAVGMSKLPSSTSPPLPTPIPSMERSARSLPASTSTYAVSGLSRKHPEAATEKAWPARSDVRL